ncbi:MAG: hypothetical protein K2I23_02645 [Clostridia bacterium]|nr:hypothetical protein [Clostridia bacterium]
MKNKKIKTVVAVFMVMLVTVFVTACGPGCKDPRSSSQLCNEYLQSCDFSLSNVAEVVLTFGCPPETYSIKKDQSAEDDGVISQVLGYWIDFQQQAVFNDDIYGYDHAVVGGDTEFKCIFVDGSYIEIGTDYCTNYVVNDFGSCQLENRDIYKTLAEIIFIMRKAEYLTNYYGDTPPYLIY